MHNGNMTATTEIKYKISKRTTAWFAAWLTIMVVLALTARPADAQANCTVFGPEPTTTSWTAWTDFPYFEVRFSDGTTLVYQDLAAGTLITAPDGHTIVGFTKCEVPPSTATNQLL